MNRVLMIILLALVLLGTTACQSNESREFIPGKGWVPVPQ